MAQVAQVAWEDVIALFPDHIERLKLKRKRRESSTKVNVGAGGGAGGDLFGPSYIRVLRE